jgi:hypothetical protein
MNFSVEKTIVRVRGGKGGGGVSVFHYVNERIITNVLVTDLLNHLRQKGKIALEVEVNGRLEK